MRGILERHGEPMTSAQLWQAFKGCGYAAGGKNPRNTLNAYLSSYRRRGTVFDRTQDGRWGLRDWGGGRPRSQPEADGSHERQCSGGLGRAPDLERASSLRRRRAVWSPAMAAFV